jgi:hypothetical protein
MVYAPLAADFTHACRKDMVMLVEVAPSVAEGDIIVHSILPCANSRQAIELGRHCAQPMVEIPAMAADIRASIVLSDMNRTREAAYGFRSWMLQDLQEPYEVVLNLFNDKEDFFRDLAKGGNPNCICRIQTYRPPSFFNISAANNLGLARANGQFVLFANSDIVYPSHYLRTFTGELLRRDLAYLLGARINLGQDETKDLPEPLGLTSFDFLKNGKGRRVGGNGSPWTIRRDIALRIGGFDPKILCHEDSEFNDRVIHFLRRSGLQSLIYAAIDMFGYHLHHAPSELYSISELSLAMLESRRERLQRQPDSDEDIVGTRFDDEQSLLRDLYDTIVPTPGQQRRRIAGKVLRRLAGSFSFLVRGTVR